MLTASTPRRDPEAEIDESSLAVDRRPYASSECPTSANFAVARPCPALTFRGVSTHVLGLGQPLQFCGRKIRLSELFVSGTITENVVIAYVHTRTKH